MDTVQSRRRPAFSMRYTVARTRFDPRPALPGWVLFAALVTACGFTPALGQSPPEAPPSLDELPKVNPDGWTSASVCGKCHQSIHAVWQQSLHAKSWMNGVFQASYRRSIDAYGSEQSRLCLSCHAPTVRHGHDYAVEDSITAEGITCDFCHSVRAVDLEDEKDPFRLTVGQIKHGPLRHAQSPAHQIVHSELHTKSEFCAACHEYTNPSGLKVLGTYSEWKSSSYAKRGTQCQDCHMPLVPGSVVALSSKKESSNVVNLHNISGSHDIDRVRSAITLKLAGYEWMSDRAWVYVKVANEGSGHCFPTGMPNRRAVLEVTIHDGSNLVGRREIPFEVVMLDKNRVQLKREHEILVKAASVRRDSRLKPNEVRAIDISFRDIKAKRLVLNAELYYSYSTEVLAGEAEKQRFEPVEMKFLIASFRSSMKRFGS